MAACIAYAVGVQVSGIAGYLAPGWLSLPLTVLWLVACTNAFNLIDGVDGLASGVGLLAAFTTLAAALLQNNAALALATAPLVGALLAFLRYNFNPASIFLGDSGSLTIGFVLGCFGAIWSQKSATLLGMTAPLMALSIPLLDTALAVVRRFLRHQPIFKGGSQSHPSSPARSRTQPSTGCARPVRALRDRRGLFAPSDVCPETSSMACCSCCSAWPCR